MHVPLSCREQAYAALNEVESAIEDLTKAHNLDSSDGVPLPQPCAPAQCSAQRAQSCLAMHWQYLVAFKEEAHQCPSHRSPLSAQWNGCASQCTSSIMWYFY